MGVINNLIQIRKKFNSIVGSAWDGTTISDLKRRRVLGANMKATSLRWDAASKKMYMTINFAPYRVRLYQTDEQGNFLTGDVLIESSEIKNIFTFDLSEYYSYIKGTYVMAVIIPLVTDLTDTLVANYVLTTPLLIPTE